MLKCDFLFTHFFCIDITTSLQKSINIVPFFILSTSQIPMEGLVWSFSDDNSLPCFSCAMVWHYLLLAVCVFSRIFRDFSWIALKVCTLAIFCSHSTSEFEPFKYRWENSLKFDVQQQHAEIIFKTICSSTLKIKNVESKKISCFEEILLKFACSHTIVLSSLKCEWYGCNYE